jgi:predicted ATPase/DNA-binding SARP family transcriptional activator
MSTPSSADLRPEEHALEGRPADPLRWRVRILGGVSVEGPGNLCDQFPTRRAALTLIRLALAKGRAVSRDALAADLWPDDFSDVTKPRMRQELNRLRRALGPAEEIIAGDKLFLRLDSSRADIDFELAERWLVSGAPDLGQAVAVYGSDLAPGYEDHWIASAREEWRNRLVAGLVGNSERLEAEGQMEAALQLARRAAMANLLNEPVQERYVRLLLACSRSEEASAHVRELNRLYPQTLGAGPSHRLLNAVLPVDSSPVAASPAALRAGRPLPSLLSAMVGRDEDLARVTAMLGAGDGPRLLTLCGPGGVGKTQLSLAAARASYELFDHRVWFIALSEKTAPALILPALAETLGVSMVNQNPLAALTDALDGAPSLLVLDNFEQLVDGGAQVVRRLLELCPTLKMLVTTRRKLNIEGEQEYPVGPLPLQAGVDLFVSVARKHRASLTDRELDREKIAAIVELMDRMPLAIHLAAPKIAVLSLDGIEDQLGRRFELLTSRRRDLPERHQNMRRTIAWSFDQLSPEMQSFFVDLSVFRGGWTTELAAKVLQVPHADERLEELLDSSFIFSESRGGQLRFNMLQTLREFARERQTATRLRDLSARLSAALLRLCREAAQNLLSPDQASWFERLDAEHDNVRAILSWEATRSGSYGLEFCSCLWRFWSIRGHQFEAVKWFDTFLPADVKCSAIAARAMLGAARCSVEQGDTAAAEGWYARARDFFGRLGDEGGVATIDLNMGSLWLLREDFERAVPHLRNAIKVFLADGESYRTGICHHDIALADIGMGDYAAAERELEAATRLLEENPDKIARAYCTLDVGRLRMLTGRPEGAEPLLQEGLAVHQELGNQLGVGIGNEFLANLAISLGDLPAAEAYLDRSLEARIAIHDALGVASLQSVRADLALAQGDRVGAVALFTGASNSYRQCGCELLADRNEKRAASIDAAK